MPKHLSKHDRDRQARKINCEIIADAFGDRDRLLADERYQRLAAPSYRAAAKRAFAGKRWSKWTDVEPRGKGGIRRVW